VRLTSARPVNAEAHEAYLKGRYYWNRRPGGLAQGIKYFQEAIEKDPGYALAFSGLADSYRALATWELGTVPPSDAMVKANAAATRALNLDESLAEAHTSLAYVKLHYYWDWSETEKELRRAIELNPNYANAHHWYSHYLMTMGRIQESLAESRRALELDPLDPVMNGHLPWHYYYAHQYDQAIEQCRKMLETGASPFGAPFELGRAYEQKTMSKEAVAQLSKAVALQGNMTFALAALGHAYAVSGQRSQALEMLNQLKQMSKERYVSPSDIAMIYAGLGEKDQALTWLERGFSERSWYMVLLKVDPRLAPLHSDPRFQDLVRRVGLPQQASF
jgi:tetratricopeptide (TPR) repeat protein